VNNLIIQPGVQSDYSERTSPVAKGKSIFSPSPAPNHVNRNTTSEILDTKKDSALHDNIRSKGKHSYYYAHGNTRAEELNRGEAPKLLSRVRIESENRNISSSKNHIKAVKTYAFIDKQRTIRIYINRSQFQDSGENENLPTSIDWQPKSVSLFIGTSHALTLPNLQHEISGASTQYGNTKLVLILKKADPSQSWETLQR